MRIRKTIGRLAAAWRETPTVWYPLPIGVGALLLAMISWRKNARRESDDLEDGQKPVVTNRRWQVRGVDFLNINCIPLAHTLVG